MGNCVKQGTVKTPSTKKKQTRDPDSIKDLLKEAELREETLKAAHKSNLKKPQSIEEDAKSEENSTNETANQKQKKSYEASSFKKKSSILQGGRGNISNNEPQYREDGKKKTQYIGKLTSENVPNHIRTQIEEQRGNCEAKVKQQIEELNLEKSVVTSAFQLLRDYLSYIKDTKKYWVSLKLLGYSKAEINQAIVGGNLSFVVEYNTGETIKLRISHSLDLDKANYDLDTFVFFNKCEHENLVKIIDYNFRISAKYMRFYIFSESLHYELSLNEIIQKQASTQRPQITGTSFRQLFIDLLDILNYFAASKFTHGGIRPSNIYIQKQLEKDGKYIQKAFLDISLSNDNYNRRNTKYRDFAFRKSSDLQMFAISMLSLISSMDMDLLEESNKKPIIQAKLTAPSIIQVDNDIRYALNCILKGSDMILEFGAEKFKESFDNSNNFDNLLGLERPSQQKNSFSFCCFTHEKSEIVVYAFYSKWAFGFRIYESLEFDKMVTVRMHYCFGDFLYLIYECEENSDLFLSRINLRKKCLDNKSISTIKSLADYICKFQGVKSEEEIDVMRAFESIDSKNEGFINSDSFRQFTLENKFKDTLSGQAEELTNIVNCFDEQDNGKLNFYEFKNMINCILQQRPFIDIEIKDFVELPRSYSPAAMMKRGNYLYLAGGTYQSLPTTKCFRFFLKNLKANQEISSLKAHSSGGFLAEVEESNKLIFWNWKKKDDFFEQDTDNQSQIVKINMDQLLNNQHQIDNHLQKNNNILKFQNSMEMKNALQSNQSLAGIKDFFHTKSLTSQLRIPRTTSFPVNLQVEEGMNEEDTSDNISMSVYNIDKNQWSHCILDDNGLFNNQNFILPLNNKGQLIIFEKGNCQNAWLVSFSLGDITIHTPNLFFEDLESVQEMIRGFIENKLNVVFYENSFICILKSQLRNDLCYQTFIINEETGRVTCNYYDLIPYLMSYERTTKIPVQYKQQKRNNLSINSSQTSIISMNLSLPLKGNTKIKIQRYTSDKIIAQFGQSIIYSAHRSSMPNVDFRILSRTVNNNTEKIDDIYESLKFITQNLLHRRLASMKDAFFTFDSNCKIKLNCVYSIEDFGLTMGEVIQTLHNLRNEARCRVLFKDKAISSLKNKAKVNKIKDNNNPQTLQKKDNQRHKKRVSKILTQAHNKRGSLYGEESNKSDKHQIDFPSRFYEILISMRNVLICIHVLQQHRFFLKEVSPFTLIRIKNGKYFSPINFYHENTFTTINSETIEPILEQNSIYEDYISPQLLIAHEQGKTFNDISYNIHKANIYSLGLVFLQYASLKRIRGFNRIDQASQIKLSMTIKSLPFPKYLQDIFTQMLKINEDERPSAVTLLDKIEHIMEDNKIDIYFPQLSLLSPFRIKTDQETSAIPPDRESNVKTTNEQNEFAYTIDTSESVLFLCKNQTILSFEKTFKLDNKLTFSTKNIIAISKYYLGFYSIIKYLAPPRNSIPQKILCYLLIKLEVFPKNSNQLTGTLVCEIPNFLGRDIISTNLHAVNENLLLIFGGVENSSIGLLEMREVFVFKQMNPFYESKDDYILEKSDPLRRLDDLQSGVIRGQLISVDPKSYEYRLFDFDNFLDEDYCNEDNILERNESDESDTESQQFSSEDSSEEEEKKDNSDVKDKNETLVQAEEIDYEYYVIDEVLKQNQTSKQSSLKYTINVQLVKLDGSIEQKHISVDMFQANKNKKNQNELQLPKELTFQYIPLSNSLLIGIQLEFDQGIAFLISLTSMKSLKLPIIRDIPDDKFIPMSNTKRISQKCYQLVSQKSFLIMFQSECDLVQHFYELDTQNIALHLIGQSILMQNVWQFKGQQQINTKPKETKVNLKQNHILLPQLTMQTPQLNNQIEQIPKPVIDLHSLSGEAIQTNQLKPHNQLFEGIQEVFEGEDTPFQSTNQKSVTFLSSFGQIKSETKLQDQQGKLGIADQIDNNQENTLISEFLENKIQNKQKWNDHAEVSEEEKQDIDHQTTFEIQKIIDDKVSNNQKFLTEQSLDAETIVQNNPTKLAQEQVEFYLNNKQFDEYKKDLQTQKPQIITRNEENQNQIVATPPKKQQIKTFERRLKNNSFFSNDLQISQTQKQEEQQKQINQLHEQEFNIGLISPAFSEEEKEDNQKAYFFPEVLQEIQAASSINNISKLSTSKTGRILYKHSQEPSRELQSFVEDIEQVDDFNLHTCSNGEINFNKDNSQSSMLMVVENQ